ncbi:hypothetical protein ES703_15299 [subsurface metagenome]
MISQQRFFETLFEDTKGYVEIRTIDMEGKVKQSWYKTEEIKELVQDLKRPYYLKTNVYFGVCARKEKEGKEKNVCQVNCFWTDIDAKNIKEKGAIKKKLELFLPEPSIIISSGRGYHCYWLLKKSQEIKSQEDIDRLKGYNKGLAEELKADTQAIDLSRVLRVPDTKNLKDPKNILMVRIVKSDPEIKYSLKNLSRFCRKIEKSEFAKTNIEEVEIPDRFYQVLSNYPKLEKTWLGKRPDLKDQTRSGYDMSLASQLVQFAFSTPEIASILRIFKYGKKADAQGDYLEWTIGKAKREYEERKNKEQSTRGNTNLKLQDSKNPKKKGRIFITGKQLVKEKVKELPAPVKKGLFVPERYTILAASDGEGKTLFCGQLTLNAITGTTFLGFFPIPKPARVLYFAGENSRGDMQTKIRRQQEELEKILGRSIDKELEDNFHWVAPLDINFFLNPRDKVELHAWLADWKPDIVIFDPLADFIASSKSLSDDTLARTTAKTLTEIAQKFKCFPIITTHLRKEAINPQTGRSIVTPENVWTFVFGSRYWLASAPAQIVIIRANLQRYPKAKKFCFKFKTSEQVEPLQVLRNPNLYYEELPEDKMSLATLTAQDVVEILERKCKGQQVLSLLVEAMRIDLGCGKTIARELINTAKKKGLIYRDPKDNLIKRSSKLGKELKI